MALKIKTILALCFTLILVGCDSPKLNPLSPGDVILAFGDSLTAGVGTQKESSYPSVLSRLSGATVINAGVSGETTTVGLNRLPGLIDEHQPGLLILLEGGNDILRNQNYQSIEQNLDQMIRIAQSRGVQVVLIGVPEKSLFSDSAPFYSELAEKYDLAYHPDLVADLMRSPSKKSDPIHFNTEGYAVMAEGIYDLLVDNGAFD